ncbi:MAG: asparagine synthase (glutamine-hydrolyzing) [Bacteroidetes bacterium]|nr:asparagine synthase (glutamine-hydrolyzing) [Bacteroidota bacterium]
MCGIAGIISSNTNKVNKEALLHIGDALAHRGPDGMGNWISAKGNVGLAHRRLAIIDLSDRAAQPMHFGDRYSIVYNGELYNYLELRKELQKAGMIFHTNSDTEVILAMYSIYQEKCLDYFDGMFAFAIWDEIAQQLFAARDRFGEKPFFYALDKDSNTLYFASEMKGLWAAQVKKVANERMLLNYLTLGYTQNPADSSETFFSGIKKLPAAHYLNFRVADRQFKIERYWNINREKKNTEKDPSKLIEKFKQLFYESVNRRLRSDVPVGTSLSGGLDSGSIVAEIVSILRNNTLSKDRNTLKTFSAIFPEFEKDESEKIKMVSELLGVPNFTVSPTATDLINDFEKICYYQEEPWKSSGSEAQYNVFKAAKNQGVKVVLDGQGADEILAGYSKYLPWFHQEMGKQSGIKYFFYQYSDRREALKNYASAKAPSIASRFLSRRASVLQKNHPYISREYLRANYGKDFFQKPIVRGLNDILYFDTFQMGLEELLRYADRNSMAHGVEVRLPFLSHELVEFIFSLPTELKIHQGFTKYILRVAMNKKLPEDIVWTKNKIGFETPQKIWMQDLRVQEMIHEARKKLVAERILDKAVLSADIKPRDSYLQNNDDWRYLTGAMVLG